jgi:mutator protein MutT
VQATSTELGKSYCLHKTHVNVKRPGFSLTRMLKDLIAGIWRRAPKGLRRWSMRFSHARFGATAAAIVIDDTNRVLLLKHVFRTGSGWGLPGGFLNAGEQPAEALKRELLEEVGLELDNLELFTVRAFKRPKQLEIVFRCRARGTATPQSFEVSRLGWFGLNDLPSGLPEDQRKLIQQAVDSA